MHAIIVARRNRLAQKRKRGSWAAACLVFAFAAGSQAGFNDTVFTSFFFIQISDLQFGMYEEPKPYPTETKNCSLAVNHINRLNPAFVVNTGDNVQAAADTAQLTAFKRGIARINPAIAIIHTPGNHDISLPSTPSAINKWKTDFGPDRTSFVYNRCLFILLNSPLIKDSTGFASGFNQQRTWLDSVLNAADAKHYSHIFVLQHYPYFLTTPTETAGYSNIDMPRRTEYLALLKRHGVTAVFAGHLHNTSEGKDAALSMVTTGPVGKPLGTGISGLRTIKVYADSVRWPFYGLNAVPQKIDMPGLTAVAPFRNFQVAPPDLVADRLFIVNAAGRKVRSVLPAERNPPDGRQFTPAAGLYLLSGQRTPSKLLYVDK